MDSFLKGRDSQLANIKFSKEDVKYVCDMYYSKTSSELAKEVGSSRSWVLKQWIENGLSGKDKSREYYSDFNYFNSIDTSNKAYAIGLIASDGNLHSRDGHQSQLRIQLKSNDAYILEGIIKDMNGNNPINEHNGHSSLVIVSDKIGADLRKIGIRENKTWDMDLYEILSNIPNQFYSDFIRGYFDGDGSISFAHGKTIPSSGSVRISMPEKVGAQMAEIMKVDFNIEPVFILDKRNKYKKPFGELSFVNATSKYLFVKMIYRNVYNNESSLFLKRKKDKCDSLIIAIESNATNRSENTKAVNAYKELACLV